MLEAGIYETFPRQDCESVLERRGFIWQVPTVY